MPPAAPVPHPTVDLGALRGIRSEIDIAGGTTAYWSYGPENASVTVVAVHGFRGEHHGLEPVVALLDRVRIISPDLPGFGQTPPLPGRAHDIEAYASWLQQFVAAVAPGAVVLGHSFGSIVAAAAVAAGLETPRLILINPIGAPALEGPRGVLTRLAIFYYWIGARLPQALGTAVLRNALIVRVMTVTMAKTKNRELMRFIHDQHSTYFSDFADRDVLHDAFVTSVSHDVSEYAATIAVPTLLIAAELDDITPIEAERRLASRFRDAELVEILGVGHLIHYERPREAAEAITRFLAAPDADDRH